jgi:hypothetical protein
MMGSVFQVEMDLAGHPLLVALGEQCEGEPETGSSIGEDRSDADAAFDLAFDLAVDLAVDMRSRPLVVRKRVRWL